MKTVDVKLCIMVCLLVGGCAEYQESFQGPRADMTEKYPRKPFALKRTTHHFVANSHFIMPPGIPEVHDLTSSIQRPIKGSGENGPPLAFPLLTDTEASYGR